MLFVVEVMMLRGGEVKDIIELKRQGLSVSQISAMSGYDRKTIRKYLGNPKIPVYKPRCSNGSKLEPFYEYLQHRMSEGVWNASVLFREILSLGYTGQVSILRDWIHPQREQHIVHWILLFPSRLHCILF